MSVRSELLRAGPTQLWGHFDEAEGTMTFETRQDVQALLDRNKALANDGDGYSPSREWRRAASIPNVVVEQWLREGVDLYNPDHAGAVKRRLNDPDNRFLRTAPGRL